ncbi:MAG TPA: STAS domain-containing protein [Polyangia bacterium]|jgi:anti-sigma B factor antagonist|nr:STAS domain-containing protein [Polyangia bacterium]
MIDVTIDEREGAIIARPHLHRLDAMAAPEFRSALLARTANRALLILSLERVRFIDSSGLGTLVSLLKNLAAGGRLHLVDVHDDVQVLLRITRLDRIFPVFSTVEDALRG